MALINFDDGTWKVHALKARVENHRLFVQYGMEMPEKILKEDLKNAARLFDQYDTTTTIADGKAPQPIAYDDGYYAVNPDLRPMAAAAGLRNTHEKKFSNGGLARWLHQWDVDHAPRIAAFLPRVKKEDKSTVPKKAAQSQSNTGAEPAKSRKRKAVLTQPSVPPKCQNRVTATGEDDDVEMHDLDKPNYGGSLQQNAIKGSTSTRTLHQKQTRHHELRNGQAIATQTHFDANKDTGGLAHRKVDEYKQGDSTENAAGHIGEDDDEEFRLQAGELQEQAMKKPTKAGKTKARLNEYSTPNTAEQLADEQQQKDYEEFRIHDARRLGGYSDPALAEIFRVRNKTVHARMEGYIRPGVEPAPTDQLGTWRLYERDVDQAEEEGRDLDLWMSRPSP